MSKFKEGDLVVIEKTVIRGSVYSEIRATVKGKDPNGKILVKLEKPFTSLEPLLSIEPSNLKKA